jgi:hypothetical protein
LAQAAPFQGVGRQNLSQSNFCKTVCAREGRESWLRQCHVDPMNRTLYLLIS